jgi:hypothetical protein
MAQTDKKVPATKVITGKVRFSYAHVFKAQASVDGGEPKYSSVILISKTDKETLKKIESAIAAAKEQGKASWGGKIPPTLKLPLRDGDEERSDQAEYKGMYFLNATSMTRPGVVDRDKIEITDSEDFYSGCYGRASLNFFPFNQKGNRGIGVGLNNVQKLAEGERLAGRSNPEDDFSDDIEDDDDDLY